MFVRAYLGASTAEQNAERAKQSLVDFANAHHLVIAKFYVENESGAKLERPKPNELLGVTPDTADKFF
nr:recombinase family protein [Moraxella osloensis]